MGLALKEKEIELGQDFYQNTKEEFKNLIKTRMNQGEALIDIVNEQLDNIILENKGKGDALIKVLHQTQELIGFIPKVVQKKIAQGLDLMPSEVSSVISFYSHFTETSRGKYEIAVCKGTACYVKDSAAIIKKIEDKYKIKSGQTTADGIFSLEVVRCLGACGLGPVMTVNGKAHGLLNSEKAISILEKYKNGEIKE